MAWRIVHACPFYPPHVGGVESHVACVVEELARRGHDVTVLTSAQPGEAGAEVLGNLRVERLPLAGAPAGTPVLRGLAERVRALRPDLVHSHSPPPLTSWQAAKAARAAGAPHVLTHHCDLDLPRWWGPVAVALYERTLHKSALRGADLVVATTRGYADTSRALWGVPDRKVVVVPNPVDAVRFGQDMPQAAARAKLELGPGPVALFVGRLAHHKGIEQFLEAAQVSGAVHAIAGEGPERPQLEGLARRLGTATRVRFLGRVPPEVLPYAYAACDVAVLPSVSRLEAFGIAALEAMASARPVVVSDIPGVREVVEPGVTGLTATPLDARALGAAIRELADDPARRARMGQQGRARVEARFATPRVVDQLEQVYGRVLER